MKALGYFLLAITLCACGGANTSVSKLNLDELKGQWVVINYWAQWCKPCIKEIPELNELNAAFSNVTVLGVNYDGASGDELASQLTQLNIRFTTLAADPAAQLGVPRPIVLPTTLILDPAGELSATLIGPQTLESLSLATGQAATGE